MFTAECAIADKPGAHRRCLLRGGRVLLGADASLPGHAQQVRQGRGPHFLHEPSSLDLDRLFLGPQVGRDLLVRLTAQDVAQHLELARRQRREALPGNGDLGATLPLLPAFRQRLADSAQQRLVAEGLGDEVDGARRRSPSRATP